MADELTIFCEALACESPADRLVYLERVCAGNPELKVRVVELLAEHDRVGSILDSPAAASLDNLTQPLPEPPGTVLGPYKLIELIGEGGMGLVYRATQQYPVRRQVALKIIKPGLDTRQVIARFEAERHALAMLDHPNIAKVFDAGMTANGRSYFIMELVHGTGVAEFCEDSRLDIRQRLELFISICHGVQHAHSAGIIHRDLKPANILVTLHDDRHCPKIIDFGIAKATGQRLIDQTLHTNFLQMLGTPVYMSPEQALMNSLDVDARSDIYSLGVILYELLTGSPPFDSQRLRVAGYVGLRQILRNEEPPRPSARVATLAGEALSTAAERRCVDPRRFQQALRGELDWVVMRALEKDRDRRYQSAGEFAADLRRYLNHEPVQARRPTTMYRLQKFVERQRTAIVVAGTLMLMTGIVLERLSLGRLHTPQQPHIAVAPAGVPDPPDQTARALAYAADFQDAWQAYRVGRLDRVRSLLEKHKPASGEVDLRGFEWWFLSTASDAPESTVLSEHLRHVFDTVWSPGGNYMATSGVDRRVLIRDGESGEQLAALTGFTRELNSAIFHPEHTILAVAEETKAASFWDWRTGELHRRIDGFEFPVARVFFTADPDVVVITDVDWGSKVANISVWRWRTGEQLGSVNGQRALAVNPERTLIAATTTSGQLNYLKVPDLMLTYSCPGTGVPLAAADFSPDGQVLVGSTFSGQVRCWNTEICEHTAFVPHGPIAVRGLSFSPDGRLVATSSDNGETRLIDRYSGRLARLFRSDSEICWSGRFSPDGKHFAASRTSGAEVYDLRRTPTVSRLIYETSEDLSRRVAVAGQTVAIIADRRREIAIHDLDDSAPTYRLRSQSPFPFFAMTLSAEGRTLWVLDDNAEVSVRELPDDTPKRAFRAPRNSMRIHLSPQRRVAAVSPRPGCWTLDPVRSLPDLPLGPHEDRQIHAFLDEQHVITTTRGTNSMEIFDIHTGRRLSQKFDVGTTIESIAVSPDRSLLAIATREPAIHLWDVATGQDRRVLLGPNAGATALAISPDGRTLASGAGTEIRLWQVATGKPLMDLQGELLYASYLAFSSDGRQLIGVGKTREERTGVIAWGGRVPIASAR